MSVAKLSNNLYVYQCEHFVEIHVNVFLPLVSTLSCVKSPLLMFPRRPVVTPAASQLPVQCPVQSGRYTVQVAPHHHGATLNIKFMYIVLFVTAALNKPGTSVALSFRL